MAKFEVGIAVRGAQAFSDTVVMQIVHRILQLPVRVPRRLSEPRPLFEAKLPLGLSYLRATTPTSQQTDDLNRETDISKHLHAAHIYVDDPLVICEHRAEDLSLPGIGSGIFQKRGIALFQHDIIAANSTLRAWRICYGPNPGWGFARQVRVCLSRIDAEVRSISQIITNVLLGGSCPPKGTSRYYKLDRFLNTGLATLDKLLKMRASLGKDSPDLQSLVASSILAPGESEALRAALSGILSDVNAIRSRAQGRPLIQVIVKELTMGDKIKSGKKSINTIGSTITGSSVAAGGDATLQPSMDDELKRRIEAVTQALTQASKAHAQETEIIRAQLDQVVAQLNRAPSERGGLLKMVGQSLAGAAQAVSDSLPIVTTAVKNLLDFLGIHMPVQ